MKKQRFVFCDEDGRELAPWELRAGMRIQSTDYSHRDGQVSCVVELGDAFPLLGDASTRFRAALPHELD